MNKILKDIINRYHVSIGERVQYVTSYTMTDANVETLHDLRQLLSWLGLSWFAHRKQSSQSTRSTPIASLLRNVHLNRPKKDLSEADSVTIRKEAEKYAKEQIQSQMAQFKQFGIMSGWTTDTTYRTLGVSYPLYSVRTAHETLLLDHDYEIRQLRIFQKMVERGLIYRHHRPVYYSPSSRSALAEAELEYKDSHVSHSVYVSYDLDLIQRDGWSPALRELIRQQPRVQLLVWTTTPWTFTANMVTILMLTYARYLSDSSRLY